MLRTSSRSSRLRLSTSPSRSPSRSPRRTLSPRRLATHASANTLSPPPSPLSSLAVEADHSYFNYTGGRWLYNEKEQLAVRHTPFDVNALKDAVHDATGGGIVIDMDKKEGVFNKSFICTLSDGRKVTARIKNPVAGPVHLTTASEVATMDFVRNVLGVPVPKVLSYCSRAETEAPNAEFIIMENAPGVQLDKVWDDLGHADKKDIVKSLIDIEQRLLKAKFASYGNLYYKTDVAEQYRTQPLLADGSSLNTKATERFCIGPSASIAYHEDERASMNLDRGPWKSPEHYLSSIADREHAWIGLHAKNNIHDDPIRALMGPESKDEHLAALKQYKSVIPALVPKDQKSRSSVLWHPDLNLGNIFVQEKNGRYEISQIIDWQGCSAGPAYLQMNTPVFLKYQSFTGSNVPEGLEVPKLPENYSTMSPQEQLEVQDKHRIKMLQKVYDIKQLLPYTVPDRYIISSPALAAGRTWKDGILPLRLALLDVALKWKDLNTPNSPCPLRFTQGEVAALTKSEDRWMDLHDFHDYLRSSFGIRPYGWVSSDAEYNQKRSLMNAIITQLPESLKSEAAEVFPRGWWPFQDTL